MIRYKAINNNLLAIASHCKKNFFRHQLNYLHQNGNQSKGLNISGWSMEDLANITVVGLKNELKRRNLPTKGLKSELQQRLFADESQKNQSKKIDHDKNQYRLNMKFKINKLTKKKKYQNKTISLPITDLSIFNESTLKVTAELNDLASIQQIKEVQYDNMEKTEKIANGVNKRAQKKGNKRISMRKVAKREKMRGGIKEQHDKFLNECSVDDIICYVDGSTLYESRKSEGHSGSACIVYFGKNGKQIEYAEPLGITNSFIAELYGIKLIIKVICNEKNIVLSGQHVEIGNDKKCTVIIFSDCTAVIQHLSREELKFKKKANEAVKQNIKSVKQHFDSFSRYFNVKLRHVNTKCDENHRMTDKMAYEAAQKSDKLRLKKF